MVKVIDAKCANNGGIILASIKLSYEELAGFEQNASPESVAVADNIITSAAENNITSHHAQQQQEQPNNSNERKPEIPGNLMLAELLKKRALVSDESADVGSSSHYSNDNTAEINQNVETPSPIPANPMLAELLSKRVRAPLEMVTQLANNNNIRTKISPPSTRKTTYKYGKLDVFRSSILF